MNSLKNIFITILIFSFSLDSLGQDSDWIQDISTEGEFIKAATQNNLQTLPANELPDEIKSALSSGINNTANGVVLLAELISLIVNAGAVASTIKEAVVHTIDTMAVDNYEISTKNVIADALIKTEIDLDNQDHLGRTALHNPSSNFFQDLSAG